MNAGKITSEVVDKANESGWCVMLAEWSSSALVGERLLLICLYQL